MRIETSMWTSRWWNPRSSMEGRARHTNPRFTLGSALFAAVVFGEHHRVLTLISALWSWYQPIHYSSRRSCSLKCFVEEGTHSSSWRTSTWKGASTLALPALLWTLNIDMLKSKSNASWGNHVFYLPVRMPISMGKVENPLEFVSNAGRWVSPILASMIASSYSSGSSTWRKIILSSFCSRCGNKSKKVEQSLPRMEVCYQHLRGGWCLCRKQSLTHHTKTIYSIWQRKRGLSILHDVSGIIKPGRLSLLLGLPGSGKITLLSTLAGRLIQICE